MWRPKLFQLSAMTQHYETVLGGVSLSQDQETPPKTPSPITVSIAWHSPDETGEFPISGRLQYDLQENLMQPFFLKNDDKHA